jgi:tetratricopeptide (TPR) repeat protein
MTADEKVHMRRSRPFAFIPWLVTVAGLLFYFITLNHWVARESLSLIAGITGWDWHPLPLPWRLTPGHPLFLVLTAPVRLLPIGWQPIALNAFAAVCAALTLGLLAASVRLLPHDRTRDQRQRENGEFSLLSSPLAFIPPLFAVLMMALQLTFWRDGINASTDMLDVLVFAFLIYCLLRFRISQNDDWLTGFAFVYGLGTTNNWALIAFFPLFLGALIWIRGVSFFNLRFIGRMFGYGVLGLLLYLLIPAMASLGPDRANFFTALHAELGAQSFELRVVPRWIVVVAALPTLLPLIFAGVRWPSFEGEISAAGNMINRYMFRALHVVFLVLALIMFFDLKYSPSLRLQEVPVKFLSFYYMGALCIGYYSGYVLLIFGTRAAQGWERRGPLTKVFNLTLTVALCVLAVAAPCALAVQNGARVLAGNNPALLDLSRESLRELPAKPSIVLTDDPLRGYLLQAEYAREGKVNKNIMLDTSCMQHREYFAYLVGHYPELKKLTVSTDKLPPIIPAVKVMEYLGGLSQVYPLCYLHPSFGYFFEIFYLRPLGLTYQMHLYPKAVMTPPNLTDAEIKTNEEILTRIVQGPLAQLQGQAKLNPDVNATCVDYSVALNWLGVEVQKAGHLPEANTLFADAIAANPQNFLARINKQYNERLQKGDHKAIDTGDYLYKALVAYHGLMPILKYNGTVDEPDLALRFGELMANGRDFRQSAILFDRRLQLLPGDAAAELDMTKTFVDWGLPDKALEWVRKLRANPTIKEWDVARLEALAYYNKNDYPMTEKLMIHALEEKPRDINRVTVLAEFYRKTGEVALQQNKEAEAKRRFTNALNYINQEQQILLDEHNAPDSHDVMDVELKKAEVQMLLKNYADSLKTLDDIVEMQPKNATALLNRATVEVQLNQFDKAKDDFKRLRRFVPEQTYLSDFGMADVAAHEKDKPSEIHYLKKFLDSAPANSPEYLQVKKRLQKLQTGP